MIPEKTGKQGERTWIRNHQISRYKTWHNGQLNHYNMSSGNAWMIVWRKIFGVPVYSVWKTWGDKRLKNATWNVTQTCSDFHLWEIVMYNPTLDQRTTLLFTPSLISLDTWQVTHLPLLQSFSYRVFFKFLFPWTFYTPSRKRYLNRCFNNCGVQSLPHRPPVFTESRFQNQNWESSPFTPHSFSLFPHWTSTNHSERG